MTEREGKRSSKDPLLESTLEEHRECMQGVNDLEACLDRQPDREGRWLAGVLEQLPKLEQTLREHFEEEQDGPVYTKLPLSYPRLASRLAKLKDEHATILEAVERASTLARRLRDAEIYELRELNAQLQLIVATIRRHEAEENEIVFEAHWNEVGGGD